MESAFIFADLIVRVGGSAAADQPAQEDRNAEIVDKIRSMIKKWHLNPRLSAVEIMERIAKVLNGEVYETRR